MLLLRCGVVMLAVLASSFVPVLANEIDAKSAYSLAQSGQLIIIDIRRPSEWRQTGIPDGSTPISLQHFSRKVRSEFFGDVLVAVQGDKSQSIGLICASGGRSAWALELLEEVGFPAFMISARECSGTPRHPVGSLAICPSLFVMVVNIAGL